MDAVVVVPGNETVDLLTSVLGLQVLRRTSGLRREYWDRGDK